MRKTAELIETINDLGNALTIVQWPSETIKVGEGENTYDTKEIYKKIMDIYFDLQSQESDLHDCVNELCLKCGSYRNEHLGACDGCRWKAVKEAL